jgi:hypothetical protein
MLNSHASRPDATISSMLIIVVTMVTVSRTVGYYTINFASPSSSPTGSSPTASTPSLRSQASNYLVNDSISCTLDDVHPGDVLLAVVQSSGAPGTNLSVSDTAGDGYTYLQDWDYDIGTGGAYANASGAGSDTITVSPGSDGAGLSLFCYDILGVTASPHTVDFEALRGNGTTPSTLPLMPPQGSFLVATWGAFGVPVQFTADPGSPWLPGRRLPDLTVTILLLNMVWRVPVQPRARSPSRYRKPGVARVSPSPVGQPDPLITCFAPPSSTD